ncbi:MAG: peptidylprolyl isomerase [candidate division WOR-3 bacterium]|nr:MAG: peptidylprolyl isomerase [candidate division WOR-3 bacterium]
MVQVKSGDKVKIHYTGKLNDETVFDSSIDREPLEFTVGDGKIIPGFEKAVVGMAPGESRTVTISPDMAYGPHREELVVDVERERVPDKLDLKVGGFVQIRQRDGGVIQAKVTGMSESKVTLDANHPLAGKDLTFDIKLVEIV